MKKNPDTECRNCRRPCRTGDSLAQLRRGIAGVLDFVPLEAPEYFCCEECLRDWLNGEDADHRPPKRIP